MKMPGGKAKKIEKSWALFELRYPLNIQVKKKIKRAGI